MTFNEELTIQNMIELMDKVVTLMEQMNESMEKMVEVIRLLAEERK